MTSPLHTLQNKTKLVQLYIAKPGQYSTLQPHTTLLDTSTHCQGWAVRILTPFLLLLSWQHSSKLCDSIARQGNASQHCTLTALHTTLPRKPALSLHFSLLYKSCTLWHKHRKTMLFNYYLNVATLYGPNLAAPSLYLTLPYFPPPYFTFAPLN